MHMVKTPRLYKFGVVAWHAVPSLSPFDLLAFLLPNIYISMYQKSLHSPPNSSATCMCRCVVWNQRVWQTYTICMYLYWHTFSCLDVTANNEDYYNQTALPMDPRHTMGLGLDTEINATILSHDRSGNTAVLDPVRAHKRPLYESPGLGGSIGEHVEVQQSPAYQAMPMPNYMWNYYHHYFVYI